MLYQELVQPVEEFLPQEATELVTIIPDHILYKIPFSVLMDSDGKYFIENHTLASSPSCYSLDLLRKRKRDAESSRGKPLLIGNPTNDLPGAGKEAKEVQKIIGGELLSQKGADIETVKKRMQTAKIVHFSCHGTQSVAKGEHPEFSGGLILAGHRYMCAEDIPTMNAALCCMGACETGKGIVRYEGVMGLGRTFLSQGCDSVIATHWAISDEITVGMMKHFYSELSKGKDKARALREAMLSVIKQKPQDWGAFFLSGLSDPITEDVKTTSSTKRKLFTKSTQTTSSKKQKTSLASSSSNN